MYVYVDLMQFPESPAWSCQGLNKCTSTLTQRGVEGETRDFAKLA